MPGGEKRDMNRKQKASGIICDSKPKKWGNISMIELDG